MARAEGRGQRQIRKTREKVGFTGLEEPGGEGVRHDARRLEGRGQKAEVDLIISKGVSKGKGQRGCFLGFFIFIF